MKANEKIGVAFTKGKGAVAWVSLFGGPLFCVAALRPAKTP